MNVNSLTLNMWDGSSLTVLLTDEQVDAVTEAMRNAGISLADCIFQGPSEATV